MSAFLYFDEHVPHALAMALRRRGVDVLRALEDDSTGLPDVALLDRATTLGRAIVTRDVHFLREASRRQKSGVTFAGVIFIKASDVPLGELTDDLELIALTLSPDELRDSVIFVPLRRLRQ